MSTTPALALIGLLLVILAIPLAFSLAPFVIGVIVLAVAMRRGHRELASGPAAAIAPRAITLDLAAHAESTSRRDRRPTRRSSP